MSAWSMLASAFCRGRRVPRSGYKQLTSKVAPRTYYKGKGCAPTGRHTRKGEREKHSAFKVELMCLWRATAQVAGPPFFCWQLSETEEGLLTLCFFVVGGYIIEPWRLPEYILPDLSGFNVRIFLMDRKKSSEKEKLHVWKTARSKTNFIYFSLLFCSLSHM